MKMYAWRLAVLVLLLSIWFGTTVDAQQIHYLGPAHSLYGDTGDGTPTATMDPLTDTSDPGYRNMIASMNATATSDFELRVLADGKVTEPEYQEAVDLYQTCVTEHGYDLTISPDPLIPDVYTYVVLSPAGTPDGTPESNDDWFATMQSVTEACADGTTMRVEALYTSQITNPEGMDYATIVLQCLEKTGAIQPGAYTRDELAIQLFSPAGPDIASGGDMTVIACLVNPSLTGLENGIPEIGLPWEGTPEATP